MKRRLAIAALIPALLLAGCGKSDESKAEEAVDMVTIEEILPQKEPPPAGTFSKRFDYVTLQLPNAWRYDRRNGSDVFIDDETHSAYMFAGCASDKWLTPDEILAQYLEKTGGSPELTLPLSEEKQDANGNTFTTAAISYTSGENVNALMFMFVPSQSRFWILKGETVEKDGLPELLEGLGSVADSALFDEEVPDVDVITENTVKVTGLDSYTIEFKKKGKFLLYYSKDNKDNERMEGTYTVLRGREAAEAAAEVKELGVTEDELNSRIRSECRRYNDFYFVTLNVDEVYRWGGKANYKSYQWLFTGILGEDGTLSMRDHLQLIDLKWTPKEK